jgi:FMN phosphatase YigB (HAD superfamily)
MLGVCLSDPLEYNREVDDELDLDQVLKPSKKLCELLASLDRTKVKPWILTNAYSTHAKRVLKLLDITQFFEGSTLRRRVK